LKKDENEKKQFWSRKEGKISEDSIEEFMERFELTLI
jgi:hypothetical protein